MLSLCNDTTDTVSSNFIGKESESVSKSTVPSREQASFSQTVSEELDYRAYETVFSIEPEMVQHTKTPALPTEYTWGAVVMVQHTKTPALPTEYTWDAVVNVIKKPLVRLLILFLLILFFVPVGQFIIYFILAPALLAAFAYQFWLLLLFTGYYFLRSSYSILKNIISRMRAKSFYAKAIGNDISAMGKILSIAFSTTDWLRPTKAKFDISPDAKHVIVNITLPDVSSMRLNKKTAKKKKLKIINEQTDADLAHDYLIYVHGVLIRTAGICFSLFPVVNVTCNGITPSGRCILSTSFDLSTWKKESPTTENPLTFIEHFAYRRDITESESLKPVTPLLQKMTPGEAIFEISKENATHGPTGKYHVREEKVDTNTDEPFATYITSESMLNYEAYTRALSPEPGLLEHTKTPKVPSVYTCIFFPKLLKKPILTLSTALWIIAALLPWRLIQYVHEHPDPSDSTGGAAAYVVLGLSSLIIAIYPTLVITIRLIKRAFARGTYASALRNNRSAMKKVLTTAFKNAKWFRRIKVSFTLLEKTKMISVTITLPYVDAMKFDKEGLFKKILYKKALYKKDIIADKEQPYNELVHDFLIYAHGVLIRTAGICFSLLPLERVTCHGITPKGKCILSVSFDREIWKKENPRVQNPLLFIEKFTYARKITEKGELEKVSLCNQHSL